jgi:hypothetical protein
MHLPLTNCCAPQDFHCISFTGDGGDTSAIHFKTRTGQEFILEVTDHILLVTKASDSWCHVGHLEVLVNVISFLGDRLDNGVGKKFFVLLVNILTMIVRFNW